MIIHHLRIPFVLLKSVPSKNTTECNLAELCLVSFRKYRTICACVKCDPPSSSQLEPLAVLWLSKTSQEFSYMQAWKCLLHVSLHAGFRGVSQQQMDPEDSEVKIVSVGVVGVCLSFKIHISILNWHKNTNKYYFRHLHFEVFLFYHLNVSFPVKL